MLMKRRPRSLRIGGIGAPLPGAHAVDVAAATRLRGAPLLSAPTPSSAALLRLPDAALPRAQRARIAFSAHVPCLLSCGRSARSPVHMARRLWQRVGDELASPHTILSQNISMEQRAAARRPQPSASLPAMQRGSALQRTLASTSSTPMSDQRSGPKPYYQ